jgi:AcrR family transcriptional regulator
MGSTTAITSQERRSAEKAALRRQIMEAAAELFGTAGYENVSMRKIAQRIGYTPMAIYLYFKDKNDLLDCICEEAFLQLYRSLERLKANAATPLEGLRGAIKGFIDFAVKHPHHYRATFLAPGRAQGSMPRRDAIRLRTRDLLRGIVAAYMGTEAADERVEIATQIVIIAGNGFCALSVSNPDFPWSPRGQVIEGLIKTIAQGLRE